MNPDFKKLEKISRLFCIKGELIDAEILPFGNINVTYKVSFRKESGEIKAYLLQELNTFVFEEPTWVMENIDLVTTHIRNKCNGGVSVHFHHTADGKNYYIDEDKVFWRLRNFIVATTFNACEDLRVLRDTGIAFGDFQNMLADFSVDRLHETIPDFHNTPKRLDRFFANVDADICGRVAEVRDEIDFLRSVTGLASELMTKVGEGEIPLRVTHNDTKANNVLFDIETSTPLTVIDLDTTMPGLAMFDFGDAVRFAASTAEEDEKDVSKVSLSLDKFRAFSEGFIGKTANALTHLEISDMTLGAITITIELATRFLDDYITGDKYFKCRYPGHNLVRTKCQIALAKDMIAKRDEMEKIVKEVYDKSVTRA